MNVDQSVVIPESRIANHLAGKPETRMAVWILLWSIALGTRVAAALILPTAEQDGYSYAEAIADLSTRMAAGNLRIADLFGFWLPLFQFVSAILNLWLHNPIVAGKIINVISGAASCVLVFALSKRLTGSFIIAAVTFVLILLNPLHVLYSAACMTDVPHGCMILATLWCVLRKHWIGAAIFGALAEALRLESWALILVLPLIQFIWERRVSWTGIGILVAPPLGWLAINYSATGDPFAYFADRARYHAAYIESHPSRAGFSASDISQDISYFGLGTNWIVFAGSIAAVSILAMRRVIRRPGDEGARSREAVGLILGLVGAALFGVLFLAYITKRQPVILPRYGLTLFCVGLPFLAWFCHFLVQQIHSVRLGSFLSAAIIGLAMVEMKPQVPILAKVLDDFQAHQRIAKALDASLSFADRSSHCFSDDVAIRILAHQPPGRFLRSEIVPKSASETGADFAQYLKEQRVTHLVFFRTEASLPVKFFPSLGESEHIETGSFELITMARSSFGPDVWLYRLHADR